MPATKLPRTSDERAQAQVDAAGLLGGCAIVKSDLNGWSELALKAARRIIDVAPRYGITADPTEFGLVMGVRTDEVSSEAVSDQLEEIIRTTKTGSLILCRDCGRDLPIERIADFAARCTRCAKAALADSEGTGEHNTHGRSRFVLFRKRAQTGE